MKSLQKLALLVPVFALSLVSCSNKTRCECLETSDSPDYSEGMCYQVSRKNVVEHLYLINLPTNPDDPDKNYKYDFEWADEMRVEYISMVEGLEGKHVISFLKLNSHSLKLTIDATVNDPTATSGYIKISHLAFKPLSDRAKNSNLYAYVSIGDDYGLVNKPVLAE